MYRASDRADDLGDTEDVSTAHMWAGVALGRGCDRVTGVGMLGSTWLISVI